MDKMENQSQPEENLVKKTCRELGITQKELAEKIGITKESLSRWNNGHKMPKSIEILLESLLKIKQMDRIESELIFLKIDLTN